MTQVISNHQKRQTALYAVGGFVVGASAVGLVLGLHNALDNNEPSSLRGTNPSLLVPDSNVEPSTSPHMSISNDDVPPLLVPSAEPTSTSTATIYQTMAENASTTFPSFDLAENTSNSSSQVVTVAMAAEVDVYALPTFAPTILTDTHTPFPTSYLPTADGPTLFPTYMPTVDRFPTDGPTQFHEAPKVIHKRSNEIGFRLKLFWEGEFSIRCFSKVPKT